ncbi:DUF4189 domain-containing protein [Methylibium petroleiphilum]|uniref:DUF4189 domain-containing protein n=1 Tax=Methylibium petroleiphilum TaxID=105560 RepID=UPI003D28534F
MKEPTHGKLPARESSMVKQQPDESRIDTRHGGHLGIRSSMLAKFLGALLAVLLGMPALAAGSAHVLVCNDSTTTPMFMAQAAEYNWDAYRVVGWTEIPPGTGGMFKWDLSCRPLTGTSNPMYFAIAHADENGKLALYAYSLDGYPRRGSWFCAKLDDRFEFRADSMEKLAQCSQGGRKLFFAHRVDSLWDDEQEYVVIKPDPRNRDSKIATFEEIAKGRYGAVALGSQRYGFGADRLNRVEAQEAALEACAQADCKVVAVTQAACAAIAYARSTVPPRGVKIGIGSTMEQAMSAATAQCRSAHGDCQEPLKAGCSGRD